jgi:hypothetical protein
MNKACLKTIRSLFQRDVDSVSSLYETLQPNKTDKKTSTTSINENFTDDENVLSGGTCRAPHSNGFVLWSKFFTHCAFIQFLPHAKKQEQTKKKEKFFFCSSLVFRMFVPLLATQQQR